jgi:large subunit ribosomal protein L12
LKKGEKFMDYIYAVLLLHKAKKEVNEENLKKILSAAGIEADNAKIKGLVSTLKDVNIEEAIEKAAMPIASATVANDVKKEEKQEEEVVVSEESAAEGLGSLFG